MLSPVFVNKQDMPLVILSNSNLNDKLTKINLWILILENPTLIGMARGKQNLKAFEIILTQKIHHHLEISKLKNLWHNTKNASDLRYSSQES